MNSAVVCVCFVSWIIIYPSKGRVCILRGGFVVVFCVYHPKSFFCSLDLQLFCFVLLLTDNIIILKIINGVVPKPDLVCKISGLYFPEFCVNLEFVTCSQDIWKTQS